uniref:Uncharacterized protein n=1 Tax=Glossina austeni TaxID=7395 RepID=A0A1A9V2Q8_GLOAU
MYRCPGNVSGIQYLADFQRVPVFAGWPLESSSFKLPALGFLNQMRSMNGSNLVCSFLCTAAFFKAMKHNMPQMLLLAYKKILKETFSTTKLSVEINVRSSTRNECTGNPRRKKTNVLPKHQNIFVMLSLNIAEVREETQKYNDVWSYAGMVNLQALSSIQIHFDIEISSHETYMTAIKRYSLRLFISTKHHHQHQQRKRKQIN